MSNEWQLHEAKARFSELFRRVHASGPQRVVKKGGEAVVILSSQEFDALVGRAGQPARLTEFFRLASGGEPLDLARKEDRTRDLEW